MASPQERATINAKLFHEATKSSRRHCEPNGALVLDTRKLFTNGYVMALGREPIDARLSDVKVLGANIRRESHREMPR
jgi:hypothetical protein